MGMYIVLCIYSCACALVPLVLLGEWERAQLVAYIERIFYIYVCIICISYNIPSSNMACIFARHPRARSHILSDL